MVSRSIPFELSKQNPVYGQLRGEQALDSGLQSVPAHEMRSPFPSLGPCGSIGEIGERIGIQASTFRLP